MFSTRTFKRLKGKRFQGHAVAGYRVQCSYNCDGSLLASGDADAGRICYYDTTSCALVRVQASAHRTACVSAEFHPTFRSTLASGGWDGTLCLFD